VRNQSSRLVASGNFDREALTTLLPEDLPTDFTSIPSPPETKPTRSRIAPRPG
jgi:AAA lid domain